MYIVAVLNWYTDKIVGDYNWHPVPKQSVAGRLGQFGSLNEACRGMGISSVLPVTIIQKECYKALGFRTMKEL